MKRLNIRWKLTLWYGGVLGVVLVLFSATIFLTMRYQLLERTDEGLAEEIADVRYEVKRADDPKTLHEWLDRRFARHEGFDFQITRPNGERFFVNTRLADKILPMPGEPKGEDGPNYLTVELAERGRWRIVSERMPGPEGPLTVQVARSLASYDHELRELLMAFLVTGPLTLLLAVSGGYLLARRALAPVQRMNDTARQVSAERLDQRLAVDNCDDELGQLAATLNDMLDRLERSFTEIRRFTADAAHELRTPLAVIRNEAEIALRQPRSGDEYGRVLENLLEETVRLSQMADQLLFLCRQDAGLNLPAREDVPLDKVLHDVVENMRLLAQEKDVILTLANNPPCRVRGDGNQLRRVFYNLIDNAIKYTGAGGSVTLTSRPNDQGVSVAVTDTGTGISAEHLPRIFDRFYRVDPARAGENNGAGLGLSICESAVRASGGTISVTSTEGCGSTFTVRLPTDDSR